MADTTLHLWGRDYELPVPVLEEMRNNNLIYFNPAENRWRYLQWIRPDGGGRAAPVNTRRLRLMSVIQYISLHIADTRPILDDEFMRWHRDHMRGARTQPAYSFASDTLE